MLEVDGDAVVPVFRGHILGPMTLVMGGVVDEDIDRAVRLARLGDAGAQRRDIGEIDVQKVRAETLALELAREARTFLDLDIEEHDDGFLLREAPHDRFADARCAAGDQNDLPGEIRIDGGHEFLPNDVRHALYAPRYSESSGP